MTSIHDLPTPALVVRSDALSHNLDTMASHLRADRCRPHVKAHKCTALAREQRARGHRTFTVATCREAEGLAGAGLGEDVLLANEVLDIARLQALTALDLRLTVAVDSEETIGVAASAGVREVVVDVNVGLPRCGCAPDDAGRIAELARSRGLDVRGVMGYEGHVVGLDDEEARRAGCEASMALLVEAHRVVGGELVSAGGTGTYAINTWASEIQAGSYALMDTAYGKLGLPFTQALAVLSTVVSIAPDRSFAVLDCGLKALGMDHGNPSLAMADGDLDAPDGGTVWFCSDEHTTFGPGEGDVRVGDRRLVIPAHVDPTVAKHDRMHVIDAEGAVRESWPVDLRGW